MLSLSVRSIFISLAACFFLGSGACQRPHQKTEKDISLSTLKKNLQVEKSREAYDSLHFLLAEHYTDLTGFERRDLRETLEKYAVWPFETTCPATESGTKITLRGHLSDENGKPLPGERLHTFHTDHRGYYAPTDSASGRMGESDPRLEGFLTTDSTGGFEIRTVRPASYPKQYEGRTIPQHVHIVVAMAGKKEENFQVVFEDDPAMSEYWVAWAKNLRNPIVKLSPNETGMSGEVYLVLMRK
ncbi:MAG: hypothetical protein H7246_07040 [Phycisphaerae bacterium]|nr:hypothetical protein [Saprospiraceae bacterium]